MNTSMEFSTRFGMSVLQSLTNCYGSDNWDTDRFGQWRPHLKQRLSGIATDMVKRFLRSSGIAMVRASTLADKYDAFMRNHAEGVAELYHLLGDEYSKKMLVDVMAYRLLGYERVKLPAHGPYLEARARAETLAMADGAIDIPFKGWKLRRFDLSPIGYPMSVYGTGAGIALEFLRKGYVYDRIEPAIGPAPGDYVIDGGAAWGDTAILFAWQVGETGRVFSFEFEPTNLEVMRRNFELNPDLGGRIEVVPKALWHESEAMLSFSANGPGTRVGERRSAPREHTVPTVALDDFCRDLPRVDFLKMDIEGAELQALQGSVAVLRKHRPKLAISLYHNLDDFVSIPRFLTGLDVDYQYFLGHSTIHQEETILFAAAPSRCESALKETPLYGPRPVQRRSPRSPAPERASGVHGRRIMSCKIVSHIPLPHVRRRSSSGHGVPGERLRGSWIFSARRSWPTWNCI